MWPALLSTLAADLAKLALIVAFASAALRSARPAGAGWTARLAGRRLALLSLLVVAVVALKVSEDVLAHESGPVDTALLWFVRGQVPLALHPLFAAITVSGSAVVLTPLAVAAAVLLWMRRQRFEAALIAASLGLAQLTGWALKTAVGRARPALWDTQWYWGSSFPSGHTLSTAAFAIAAALCVARIWPQARAAALGGALLWAVLVGLSRLVLGVHWPSDVLAALCIGAFIPLALSLGADLRRPAAAAARDG